MLENKEIILELGTQEVKTEAQEETLPADIPNEIVKEYQEAAGLSEAEKQMVEEFSEKIDLRDSAIVLQYGAAC